MPKDPRHADIAAMRSAGRAWWAIGAWFGIPAAELRERYEARQREMRNRRDREYREDTARPGVTVTWANKHMTAFVSLTRNGPGGPDANLLEMVDAVGPQWSVLCISTTNTVRADLRRTSKPNTEALFLGRINRIGRLHPSLWPRWREDRIAVAAAARRPLGEGRGRSKSKRRDP